MSAAALYYLLNPKDTHKTGAPCVSSDAPWAGLLAIHQPVKCAGQIQLKRVDVTNVVVNSGKTGQSSALRVLCYQYQVGTFCLLCAQQASREVPAAACSVFSRQAGRRCSFTYATKDSRERRRCPALLRSYFLVTWQWASAAPAQLQRAAATALAMDAYTARPTGAHEKTWLLQPVCFWGRLCKDSPLPSEWHVYVQALACLGVLHCLPHGLFLVVLPSPPMIMGMVMTAFMGQHRIFSCALDIPPLAWPLPAGSADPGQARGSHLRAVCLPRTS